MLLTPLRVVYILAFIVVCGFTCHKHSGVTVVDKPVEVVNTTNPYFLPPDTSATIVEITTSMGVMKAELYCNTPDHKENFLKLVNEHFYDNLLFHRVINGFMIQGGDPTSKNAGPHVPLGGGGPGYTIDAEINSDNVHIKGALCAARLGDDVNPEKASSGSQFYIVHGRPQSKDDLDRYERTKNIVYTAAQREAYEKVGGAPQLDMEYTVFGRVFEGLDVLDKIATTPTQRDRPSQNVSMKIR